MKRYITTALVSLLCGMAIAAQGDASKEQANLTKALAIFGEKSDAKTLAKELSELPYAGFTGPGQITFFGVSKATAKTIVFLLVITKETTSERPPDMGPLDLFGITQIGPRYCFAYNAEAAKPYGDKLTAVKAIQSYWQLKHLMKIGYDGSSQPPDFLSDTAYKKLTISMLTEIGGKLFTDQVAKDDGKNAGYTNDELDKHFGGGAPAHRYLQYWISVAARK